MVKYEDETRKDMNIRSIKYEAKKKVKSKFTLYMKISSIQAAISLVGIYMGLPLLLQILQYESFRSQGITTNEPNTFLFAMIFAAYQIISVMLQSLLIAYMNRTDDTKNIMPNYTSFGTIWATTGIRVYLKRILGAIISIIPFTIYGIQLSHGVNNEYLIWIGYIIGMIGYFIAPTRSYIALAQSVILTMDSKQSISESKALLNGKYLEVTKLKLSFILWDLANIMTCGILSIYLTPYKIATMLEYRKEVLK